MGRRLLDEHGSITLLITGLLVVILMVVAVGTSITGVHLDRNAVQSMADGAALTASQQLDEDMLYTPDGAPAGVNAPVRIDEAEARRAATAYLRTYPQPSERLSDLRIDSLAVGEDGTVTVVVAGRTDPPLIGWVTGLTGTSVPLSATGHARSS
ncbi:MAG: Tad domain-containing protein [Brachybacterium sp.]|nr:Tad domain-containing protein [Brachybacterium sp.]